MPIRRLAGIQHGAAAGEHRAAQDGGDVRGHVVANRNHRLPVQHGVRREPRDPQMVTNLLTFPM